MPIEEDPPRRRSPDVGRRNPRTHRAVLDATRELLMGTRYHDLTIEAIAAKAGVGKATVYRWWPSKGALVAETIVDTLVVEDPPKTGDLRTDLIAALAVSTHNYVNEPGGHLLHALASDIADEPTLLRSFRDNFMMPRRKTVAVLIKRAMAEGLLPPTADPDLIMDMWAGALFYRGLFKHVPMRDGLAAELVDSVILPKIPAGTPP